MDSTLIAAIQAGQDGTSLKTDLPVIKTGQEVEVQIFRGLVISHKGDTPLSKMITVRATLDGIGIEKIFPIHSPFIAKIVVLRQFKVRRKSIKYIRDLTGKAARLKEIK